MNKENLLINDDYDRCYDCGQHLMCPDCGYCDGCDNESEHCCITSDSSNYFGYYYDTSNTTFDEPISEISTIERHDEIDDEDISFIDDTSSYTTLDLSAITI